MRPFCRNLLLFILLSQPLAVALFAIDATANDKDVTESGRPILHLGFIEKNGERIGVLKATSPNGQLIQTSEAFGAVWAPDGKEFAFISYSEDNRRSTLNVTSLEARQQSLVSRSMPQTLLWYPSWSPDGRKIAVLEAKEGNTIGDRQLSILVVDRLDKTVQSKHEIKQYEDTEMPLLAGFPFTMFPPDKLRWSPDGRKLLISWGAALVLDFTNEKFQLISKKAVLAEWSPNSKEVYFIEIEERFDPTKTAFHSFKVFDLDRENSLTLADRGQLSEIGFAVGPTWGKIELSTGGSYLAVGVGMGGRGQNDAVRIYDLRADAKIDLSEPSKVIKTNHILSLDWSPNERALAVADVRKNTVEFKVINLADQQSTILDRLVLENVFEVEAIAFFKNLSWTR